MMPLMTAKAQTIERDFRALSPEEQAEVIARLETILYGEDEGDRIALQRANEMAEGKVKALSEAEAWSRFPPPPK
jgi:hypothetical protein